MKGTNRNEDFVLLAIFPFIAAVIFIAGYVNGVLPTVPVPTFISDWLPDIDQIRQTASQNQTSVLVIGGAIVAGILGFTWLFMVILDIRTGVGRAADWITRRKQSEVSGLLRTGEKEWSAEFGTGSEEEQKRYRVHTAGSVSDRSR